MSTYYPGRNEYTDLCWDVFTQVIKRNVNKKSDNDIKATLMRALKYVPYAYFMKKAREENKSEVSFGMVEDFFWWEANNLKQKPIRTMSWFSGEHACLYDQFICKECGTIVTTHDDRDECLSVSVICPECNKDIFRNKYEWGFISGKLPTGEENPNAKLAFLSGRMYTNIQNMVSYSGLLRLNKDGKRERKEATTYGSFKGKNSLQIFIIALIKYLKYKFLSEISNIKVKSYYNAHKEQIQTVEG